MRGEQIKLCSRWHPLPCPSTDPTVFTTCYLFPLGIRKCDSLSIPAGPSSSDNGLLPATKGLLEGAAGVNRTNIRFMPLLSSMPEHCREPGATQSVGGSGIPQCLSPGAPSAAMKPLEHHKYHHSAEEQWHLCISLYVKGVHKAQ